MSRDASKNGKDSLSIPLVLRTPEEKQRVFIQERLTVINNLHFEPQIGTKV